MYMYLREPGCMGKKLRRMFTIPRTKESANQMRQVGAEHEMALGRGIIITVRAPRLPSPKPCMNERERGEAESRHPETIYEHVEHDFEGKIARISDSAGDHDIRHRGLRPETISGMSEVIMITHKITTGVDRSRP